jgi:hypothetical protein
LKTKTKTGISAIAVIIAFIMVAYGCKKNNDNDQVKSELKLSRMIEKNLMEYGDSTIYDFDYSVPGEIRIHMITQIYFDFWHVYKFDAQHRLSEYRYEKSDTFVIFKTSYIYNNNNTVTTISRSVYQPNPYDMDSVVYYLGDDGLAQSSVMYQKYFDPDWSYSQTSRYTWQNGELAGIFREYDSSLPDTSLYKHSIKGNNPLNFTTLPLNLSISGDHSVLLCGKYITSEIYEGYNTWPLKILSAEYNIYNYPVKLIKGDDKFPSGFYEYRFYYITK